MDDYTRQHLTEYANRVCWYDEIDQFVEWVEGLDTDDLIYHMREGWPTALAAWRRTLA